MAITLSTSQFADLRREFLSRLTGEELEEIARQISEKADDALSEAGAAAAIAAAAATPDYVDGQLVGVATEAYVDSKVASETAGLATEGYADAAAAAAVVGLASTDYVDGKFDSAFSGDLVVASVTAGKKITITVLNGLITGFVEAAI